MDILGWLFLLSILTILVGLGVGQWRSYVSLDRRIEAGDESLIHGASTRLEKVIDAPQGSVIVPYVPAQMVEIHEGIDQRM